MAVTDLSIWRSIRLTESDVEKRHEQRAMDIVRAQARLAAAAQRIAEDTDGIDLLCMELHSVGKFIAFIAVDIVSSAPRPQRQQLSQRESIITDRLRAAEARMAAAREHAMTRAIALSELRYAQYELCMAHSRLSTLEREARS